MDKLTIRELNSKLQKINFVNRSQLKTKQEKIRALQFVKQTLPQLRKLAKDTGIKGYSNMKKNNLINKLFKVNRNVVTEFIAPIKPKRVRAPKLLPGVLFEFRYPLVPIDENDDIYQNYFLRQILVKNNIYGKIRVSYLMKTLQSTNKKIVYNYEQSEDNYFDTVIHNFDYHYDVPALNKTRWYEYNGIYNDWRYNSTYTIFDVTAGISPEAFRDKYKNNTFKLLITRDNQLSGKRIAQKFATGPKHCVLNPIVEFCDQRMLNVGAKTQEMYKTLKNKCNRLAVTYESGIPEDKLQSVCDILNVNLTIKDIFNNEFLTVKTIKAKPITTFNYINSKLNHVEFDNLINAKTTEVTLTKQELNNLYEKLKTDNSLFRYDGMAGNIHMLIHNSSLYTTQTKYKDSITRFYENEGKELPLCAFDILSNPSLTKFIALGTHMCGTIDLVPDFRLRSQKLLIEGYTNTILDNDSIVSNFYDNDITFNEDGLIKKYYGTTTLNKHCRFKQIDQEKSYTQFKQTGKYYLGFMSVISSFSNVQVMTELSEIRSFLSEHVGIYYVNKINFDNINDKKMLSIFEKMNIYNSNYTTNNLSDLDFGIEELTFTSNEFTNSSILASPELIYLLDLGVTFNVVYGAFCTKPLDFEFPEYMKDYESDDDKVKFYSKFAGKCMQMLDTKIMKVHCDYDLAEHLASIYPKRISYNSYFKEMKLTTPKTQSFSLSHISAYLTTYMRINVFEQLRKMDIDKILRVTVDGIYYEDHDFELMPTFRDGFKDKACRIPGNYSSGAYFNSTVNDEDITEINNYIKDIKYEYNAPIEGRFGGGGCGKTHLELQRKDYISPIFSTVCKRLITAKKNEYQCNGITMAKLLSGGWRKYLKVYPGNILFDECTMISNNQKKDLIKKFPFSHIIFMGDIDRNNTIYQLPCVEGPRFKVTDINYIKDDYHTMYRCKCNTLKALILKIREAIKQCDNNEDFIPEVFSLLRKDFIKLGITCTIDDVKNMYKIDDYIITPRIDHAAEWTKIFKGKFEKEKYYITKNNQFYDNGNIVISDKQPKMSIVKHAYTIHSIQGQTCKSTIFIDMRNMFGGLQMLYTAISRAEYIENIRIIY